jgi:hypothetical protein
LDQRKELVPAASMVAKSVDLKEMWVSMKAVGSAES